MKTFTRSFTVGVILLLLAMSTMTAQEVAFGPGPTIAIPLQANNSGFAWGDVNKDGNLDVLFRQNNLMLNVQNTSFVQLTSAGLPAGQDATGMAFADFNGDGYLDVLEAAQGAWTPSILIDSAGVMFSPMTGTGDLATAGGASFGAFIGMAATDIDHSNYLSLAYAGQPSTGVLPGNNNPTTPGGGVWLLKGGASGFTNAGRGALAANLSIDTSLTFESWDVRFLDANNDGYPDLLMPSIRGGFSTIDTGSSGSRKGCVLYVNDGTGKFIVPTSATIPGNPTIYSVGAGGVVSTTADTGIIVDDTVRHFTAIGEQWGDLNNDGIPDLFLNGLGGSDNISGNGNFVADVILYGKGDGTFTYRWDGVNIVANNGITQNTAQRAISIGDYNNDGLQDIYTCATFGPAFLYRNNGDGTFTNQQVADNVSTNGSRGGQFVDYNSDGFLDIFQYTSGTTLLQKNFGNTNKWIGFIPQGTGHNVSAIGAKFTVYASTAGAGKTLQARYIKAEAGSAGMGGELRALFGLGSATKVDSLQVAWPDGQKQTFILGAANNTIALNAYYLIQEGSVIPSTPVTIRPSWAANDTSLSSTDTLMWHAAVSGAGTTTYQVQVASNASFTSIARAVTVTDTSTIMRLGLSTKYYWRVRAVDNALTGAYSAVDSFRTLVTPCLTTPNRLLPASNSTTVKSVNPVLVASYVSTASTYHFQVDSVNRFTTNLVSNDSLSDFDTTFTIPKTLTPNSKYYWRVRGYNPAGSSDFSAVDSFTIMFIPQAPVLVYPVGNSPNVSAQNLVMKWRSVAGDSNYVVQFWTSGVNGLMYTVDSLGAHDTTLTVPALINRAKYYWHVLAWNQGGTGPYSAVDSFTTITEVADAPVLVSPKSPATSDMRATFVWNSAVNALKYHLQVSTGSTFSTTIEDAVVEDTTYLIPDTLVASTTYYWRVSSINLGGEGTFSGAAHFATTDVVGVEGTALQIPKAFALRQNYPNPFNPSTMIQYELPTSSKVSLKIYDVLGRLVATLVDGIQAPNTYRIQWNPARLSSGVYFARIQARSEDGSKDFTDVKKLMFMK
jgi:hypothetical protein